MTTKERILEESMKLFSIHGFDSVSVRSIAQEVGVTNSALYKHFQNKQAIFDAIVEKSQERFLLKYKELNLPELQTKDDVEDICIKMFLYQTKDSWVIMFRRMLVMEMFKNQQMAKVYKKIFITMPIEHQTLLFQSLIDKGKLRDCNAEVMAIELYAPFFLYHSVNEDSKKLDQILRKHISNFIENYMEVK